jgi:hypothetical protein
MSIDDLIQVRSALRALFLLSFLISTPAAMANLIADEPIVDPTTATLGTTLTYTYTITNSGPNSVSDITILDSCWGPIPEPSFALAPGERRDVQFVHTVAEADLPKAPFISSIIASGVDEVTSEPVDIFWHSIRQRRCQRRWYTQPDRDLDIQGQCHALYYHNEQRKGHW